MIIGYDWGNNCVKICTPYDVYSFPSNIIAWQEEWVDFTPGGNDFIFEYKGRKGIIGDIARDESTEIDMTKKGDTKLHEDALIRLLVGLHRYADEEEVKVVVGQPINQHQRDKEALIDLVKRTHTITVNGVEKDIAITDVLVGIEGGTAVLANPSRGTVHLIDVGSGTINLATVKEGRFLNSQSGTIPKGIENIRRDPETIVTNVVNYTRDNLGWKDGDPTYLLGGGAHILREYVDYPLFIPFLNGTSYDPVMANSIGFYKLGEGVWQKRI